MKSTQRYNATIYGILATILILIALVPDANCQTAGHASDLTPPPQNLSTVQTAVSKSDVENSIGPSNDAFAGL